MRAQNKTFSQPRSDSGKWSGDLEGDGDGMPRDGASGMVEQGGGSHL